MRKQYAWWMTQPHETFQRIIDLNDQVMLILATHFVSLQVIMVFILESVRSPDRVPNKRADGGMARWLRCLNPLVGGEFRAFNRFPAWVGGQMERDPGFFGKSV